MEDFVTYKQAKILKEVGFNWKVTHCYTDCDECQEHFIYPNEIECLGKEFITADDIVCNNNSSQNDISAPTLSQVQRWLREKHNIIILVDTYFKNYLDGDYSKAEFEYIIVNMNHNAARKDSHKDNKLFETYERALESGIDVALELLKLENK